MHLLTTTKDFKLYNYLFTLRIDDDLFSVLLAYFPDAKQVFFLDENGGMLSNGNS